jgi:maltose alpha-D-glucosyltransferase/alpha-amylase
VAAGSALEHAWMTTRAGGRRSSIPAGAAAPLWYKDAIIYELHVRAFADSDGDGIGDFRGLTSKLDYLQDLGITAIWLLPFYPSPLRDDGYDIADYTEVHPSYGTLHDVEVLLREAHARGLRVITELVLNHTSDEHPWFQRARRSKPGSRWRDFYVWSDDPGRYAETRIIFKDFETSNWTWDPVANAYYWHRFYSHQPDLNFDNPAVRKIMLSRVDFWLRLGVDGLRLDAVPYLFEREGTNCENLPETHAFLKQLRKHIDANFSDRMLLAEANQWPEDAAAYFGDGDECHMAFHFPVMPRIFMASRMEDRFPIIEILDQTPAIPATCQWAIFLRNHDELTLEMVTDEERDYMYRVYADDPQARINLGIRRRLAPLFGNNRRQIELMYGLLLSLPGTPVLYYGDEIGMGDNFYLGDRNGVRTPMQWSADRNAGFSTANPQRLYLPVVMDPEYRPEALNVQQQQDNPHSLLWWVKRLIAQRKRYAAFGRGTLEFLYPENSKVLAFVRSFEDERLLVVANLSRHAQFAELDLSAHRGLVPTELFGTTDFPPIGDLPYLLTLAPHAFYWFVLREREPEPGRREGPPLVAVRGKWRAVLADRRRAALEPIFEQYLAACRWFGGKARVVKATRIAEVVPVNGESAGAVLLLIDVSYRDGEDETYMLPVAYAEGTEHRELPPEAIVARIRDELTGDEGVLYDALADRAFGGQLLDAIANRTRFRGAGGEVRGVPNRALRPLLQGAEHPEATPIRAEQSNTSLVFGERVIMKVYRRVERGINPDLEIGAFLTERAFPNLPALAGSLGYEPTRGAPITLALLQAFVPNQGDAWRYTLGALAQYCEGVLARRDEPVPPMPDAMGFGFLDAPLPPIARASLGAYLPSVRLLGQRTAELHVALASRTDDPSFAPEPFTTHYQRSIYQTMRAIARQSLDLLRRQRARLPENARADAERVLGLEAAIDRALRRVLERKLALVRIRCHGDYHLGQVLYTGKDFVITDFEGEPARALSERRIKRSALRDVAGMLRSFHYAASTALLDPKTGPIVRPEDQAALEPWIRAWCAWVGGAYLAAYVETAGAAPFLPRTREELRALTTAYALEKALYEVRYELNNRPGWVRLPLRGVAELLAPEGAA